MWSCSCLLFWEKFIIDWHMLIKGFTLCPAGFSSNVNYSTFHMFWFSNMFAVVGSQFYCFATFKFTSVFHCPSHSLPLVSSQRNPNSFNLFLTFNFQTCQNWTSNSIRIHPSINFDSYEFRVAGALAYTSCQRVRLGFLHSTRLQTAAQCWPDILLIKSSLPK